MAAIRYPAVSRLPVIAIAAAALLFSLTVPLLLMPWEWAGWLVMYASFGVVLLSGDFRKETSLMLAAVAVVAAHHLVSLINVAIVTLPGAELDARTFHHEAVRLAGANRLYFDIGYEFYENFLGLFYVVLGPSQLLGQGLSVLAFTLSCIVFMRLLDLFAIKDFRWTLLLFYGLMPSTLLMTSFTLREAWQLLFFMLTVLCGLQLIANRRASWLVALLVCALGLALFHKGLVLYSVCFVLLSLVLVAYRTVSKTTSRRKVVTAVLVSVLFIGLAFYAIESTQVGGGLLGSLSSYGVVDYIYTYRMQIDFLGQPRTAYNVDFDSSTLISTCLTFVKLHFYYLFAPWTGGGGSVKDLYGLTEALLRFALILSSIVTWYFSRTSGNSRYGFLLLCYASMTFMWALGTTNYGQAIRHHVLTNWIIILAGMPAILHVLQIQGSARKGRL